ncbi:hypothetical protein [Angelakisella massiliensis]|uniref:hypothetical protein n=1 Tax=Angelakisella massiliensis TaxID=1871018 RepID=UPI0024B201C5|nr:hypothetical protein [Angelakisella massiliensis]
MPEAADKASGCLFPFPQTLIKAAAFCTTAGTELFSPAANKGQPERNPEEENLKSSIDIFFIILPFLPLNKAGHCSKWMF